MKSAGVEGIQHVLGDAQHITGPGLHFRALQPYSLIQRGGDCFLKGSPFHHGAQHDVSTAVSDLLFLRPVKLGVGIKTLVPPACIRALTNN